MDWRRLGGMTAIAMSGVAGATTVLFGPGAGGNVPWVNALGPGTLQTSITVTDGRRVSGVSVLLTNLLHSWMGELSARLTHVPTGRAADLFHRVGSSGANPSGDSSDFVGRYTFADGGADLAAVAAATGATSPIAGGTYAASGAGGSTVSLAGVFGGIEAAGEWRLAIRNHGTSDVGTLGSWTLGLTLEEPPPLTTIPLAGAWALGLCGLGAAGARRRRR